MCESPWGFAGAVAIVVRYDFEDKGDATLVKVKHTIVGDIPEERVGEYESHITPLKKLLTDYFATLS